MKEIGKTVFDILNSDALPQIVKNGLEKYFKDCFETDVLTDEALRSDTKQTLGGYYFLIDSEDKVDEAIEKGLPVDVLEEPQDESISLDTAIYLDEGEAYALLSVMTSHEGGDMYIINDDVLELYPEIRSHITLTGQV